MILGFSVGTMRKFANADQAVKISREIGANALEINEKRLPGLTIKPEGFEYFSIHGRGPHNNKYKDDPITHRALRALENQDKELDLRCLVIHPRDVEDWAVFKNYNLPFAIENMDNRDPIGTTVEEIAKLVKQTGFNMVLDVNHCFTHDPTMALAKKFMDKLGDKIILVHISGYKGPDLNSIHVPLFLTGQQEIIESVKGINKPFIIESRLQSVDEAKKEFLYIKNILES